jgi:hypothetical protein
MPLWLFDPAEPSASPTYRPLKGERGQSRCGGSRGVCNMVPRYWQVILQGVTDPADSHFNGTHVLARDLSVNWTEDAFCRWSAIIHRYSSVESLGVVLTYTDLNALSGGEGGDPDWCVFTFFTDLGVDQIYNVRSLQQPNTMFRCCSKNTMGAYSPLGGATTGVPGPGYPATIIAQPFWP